MGIRYFSKKVAKWYKEHHRNLPWRSTRDPYRIWLSEIILQQTRVNQGLPYYEHFIEKYPNVRILANAPEQDVLRSWQGLGYYTRARNLHRCAKEVSEKYNGVFPDTFEALHKLPGIGDYTAAAIASIAYCEPVAVVDGNVYRVLARIFGIETAVNSNQGKKEFSAIANEILDKEQPNIHNQAMMEFGALFCTPKNPNCVECTFKSTCVAYKGDLQHVLPVKTKPKKSRKRYFYYFVLQKGKSLALKKREEKDIWHGLYDFTLIERDRPAKMETLTQDKFIEKLLQHRFEVSEEYKHVLSHQTIHARFILVRDDLHLKLPKGISYYSPIQIAELPKPVLISRFLMDKHLL